MVMQLIKVALAQTRAARMMPHLAFHQAHSVKGRAVVTGLRNR
jgi:hypothetical protein